VSEAPLIGRDEIVREMLENRHAGAVTDAMVQAALAELLDEEAKVKLAARLGTSDATVDKIEQRDEEELMTALGETSPTTAENWGARLRMIEAYQGAYLDDPPNDYEVWPRNGGWDGYSR
jgi:hypothetical protein